MEKSKEQTHFSEHIVRKALYLTWQKCQLQTYKKIPIWVAPIEAFTLKVLSQEGALLTYRDLSTKDQILKNKQDLEGLGLSTDWWSMLKLEDIKRIQMWAF